MATRLPSVIATGDLIPYGPDLPTLLLMIVFLVGGLVILAFTLAFFFERFEMRRDFTQRSSQRGWHLKRGFLVAVVSVVAWLFRDEFVGAFFLVLGVGFTLLQIRAGKRPSSV